MSTKLRNNPFQLVKTAQAQRKAQEVANRGRPTSEAPWLQAVRLHPPAASPLPYVVPTQVGHFNSAADAAATTRAQMESVSQVRRTRARERLAVYTKAAPAIAYPEDSLRTRFYAAHPFELLKPRNLVESVIEKEAEAAADQALVPPLVNAESVIQRTLHYMHHDNLAESVAYDRALSEFYEFRRDQEKEQFTDEERKRQELLKKLDALMKLHRNSEEQASDVTVVAVEGKEALEAQVAHINRKLAHKSVDWFTQREEAELAESKAYLDQLDKEREEKREVQEKMAQFEARNLKKDAPF
ncbi:mitochondrial ribosomal protein S25-domain-containing protein [Chytriomyces sp. MP71]|nr:mitochondrial ribosomal protein S25-domain-containing protein [Chytriomyces sp. MP71]